MSSRGNSSKVDILELEALTASPFTPSSTERFIASVNNALLYWDGTSWTTVGSVTGGSIPSLDAILQNDQTVDLVALPTLTIDRSSGNNDVLTVTNTGAGSGDCIQITNAGTGNDIEGTSDTWHFTKAGDMTANMAVFSGDAGSDSLTLTAGDAVLSDGSLTITDADDAATLSITNNTATSASVFVFAGSGVFTGSTTTSFMTITPSGMTTGTAVYLPVAAMTTGKAVHVVANAVTTGVAVHIASSVGSTTLTGAGRLFKVDHTGTATGTGILSEFNSAATDETVITKITASAALALGAALQVSVSSMTTGTAIKVADLDAITTGIGLHIASAATAIATTGRMVYVNHTGTTSTSGILAEFASAATDETTIVKITASAANALGSALTVSTATTTGTGIAVTANAVTTGQALLVSSSVASTTLTGTGRLFKVNHSGNATGSGIIAEIASAAADETIVAQVTASAAITGSVLKISADAMAEGNALYITATEATLTTGKYINCYDGAASDFSVAKYGATVIAGNAIGTAALTLTNGDALLSSGNLILTSGHIKNTPQAIVNANTAISIVTLGTTIANNAPSTHTLADGTVGQLKYIVCTVYTGDAVITPANFVGTTITLNAAGDSWLGVFVGTEWVTLSLGGTAAVA